MARLYFFCFSMSGLLDERHLQYGEATAFPYEFIQTVANSLLVFFQQVLHLFSISLGLQWIALSVCRGHIS